MNKELMAIKHINNQYGNCFSEEYRIDFIGAAYKEEHRLSRLLGIEPFMRGIAVLFIRGA